MKKQGSEPLRHIPWGYGITRVTAMAVDPERLYVYWEITDSDLERVRATLPEGADPRLVLRIFDTTGRIFDGSNAHSSIDVTVQRSDRQWFLSLNRPNSSAVVEIGVLGPQGAYAPLARSKPVDFPRREPAPPSEPEWRIAEDVVASGGVGRVRLKTPPSGTTPRSSQTGGRGKETPGASSHADGAVPGGGSEERLRDTQNGKSRES